MRLGAQHPPPAGAPAPEGPGAAPGQLPGGPDGHRLLLQRGTGGHAGGDGAVYPAVRRLYLPQHSAGLRLLLWGQLRGQLRGALCQPRRGAGLLPQPHRAGDRRDHHHQPAGRGGIGGVSCSTAENARST